MIFPELDIEISAHRAKHLILTCHLQSLPQDKKFLWVSS